MPVTSGTSAIGLQLLGSFSSNTGSWQLRLAQNPPQQRLQRLGTVLRCRRLPVNRFPVIQVFSLFGGGLHPPTITVPTPADTDLWVDWFFSGIAWEFDRP